MKTSAIWCVAALALSTGCSKPDNAPGPGGVSLGEARALDEAAQMLDDQQLPPEAVPALTPPAPPGAPASGKPQQ